MLYGGLNPVNIFFVYVGTAAVVVFAAGFSILISILARRPRDAILAAYFLGALWLLVPPQIEGISSFLEGPLVWVPPVNDSLIVSKSDPRLVGSDIALRRRPLGVWRQNAVHAELYAV